MLKLTVNGEPTTLDVDPAMPLLYALRETLGLTATKFGCGAGQCGACTVQLDGEPIRACLTPVSVVAGKKVTTLEGLPKDGQLHPVQQAWLDEKVPQCGYCQAGQMMTASALLAKNPTPSDAEITEYMQGNICRCGTYPRIRAAIKSAGAALKKQAGVQVFEPKTKVEANV